MRVRVLALGILALLTAVDVSAQTCLGLPSFTRGPFQAAAGAAFTDGAQRYGGSFAAGSEEIFGGLSITFTDVSDLDSTATSIAPYAGASYVLNRRERIEACPVAAVIITSGPDVGEVDVSGVGLRAGGRLGLVAAESGNVEFVPTFGLDIAYDRVKAEFAGVETTERDTYVIARAGLGLVFNQNIGLLSTLSIPLGLDGADPEFSILVAYTFGR